MLFNATYYKTVLGREFFFIIYLKKPLSIITLSLIILEYIKASANNPDIFINLYIPGIIIIIITSKVLRVMIQNIIFVLDYTSKVILVEDVVLWFRLMVQITKENDREFII
jgi:hypothetical protein